MAQQTTRLDRLLLLLDTGSHVTFSFLVCGNTPVFGDGMRIPERSAQIAIRRNHADAQQSRVPDSLCLVSVLAT